ncbi:GspH/FimT family pseudopilin [Nostoc sp. CHAB 5834]|nr:GspH/FimT family pseudopilin [Nostoc sp. CHAB 5834]
MAGFTLLELMVVLAISAIVLLQAVPALGDYIVNTRVKESANLLVSTANLARNEALKRNLTISLVSDGTSVSVQRAADGKTTVFRTVRLAAGTAINAFTVDFDSAGRVAPFGTSVTTQVLPSSAKTCPAKLVCPSVQIEAGGGAGICKQGDCT